MFISFRTVIGPVAAAVLLLAPSHVWAQPPSPPAQDPPPTQDPPPAQDPLPPPPDDGPKPAGVGTSAPPKTADDEQTEDDATDALEPERARTFPGYTELGRSQPGRPFSGLFGGAEPASRQKHSLSLSGSLVAGYSTNVAPQDLDGQVDPLTDEASQLVGGNGSLDYVRTWQMAALNAYVNGSRTWIEAYESTGDPWVSRWDVGTSGGFSTDLNRRLRFSVNGTASYSPYVQFGSPDFGAGSIASLPVDTAGLDYALTRDPSVGTSGSVTLSYALTRKSSFEGYYTGNTRIFVASQPQNSDRLDQTVGGRYRYSLGRYVGVRAGYGFRRASFGESDSRPFTNHVVDVGVDAGRAFALTRRTTLSFGTDSNVFVDGADTGGSANDADSKARLFVGGNADLAHTMGQTWAARAGYRRGVNYQVGFDEPILSDTGYASLSGLITPRLDFDATASYTFGHVGFTGDASGFGTSTAIASLRLALSRNLAAYAQYFYYHYDFEQGVTLPGYLGPQLDRQGATVGLTAWLPVIGSRGRR